MAILHGSWLTAEQRFFLWGETWQRLDPDALAPEFTVHDHPFAIAIADLVECLHRVGGIPKIALVGKTKGSKNRGDNNSPSHERSWSRWLSLPTALTETHCLPQHSATNWTTDLAATSPQSPGEITLYPWQVSGLWLTPSEAATFLQQLPLGPSQVAGVDLGPDLRYWSQIARWGLDLLARSKYLPSVVITRKATYARWQVLLDSDTDTQRLRQFKAAMPLACRTYQTPEKTRRDAPIALRVDQPEDSEALLQNFLGAIVDAQVRSQSPSIGAGSDVLSPDLPVREWLQALSSASGKLEGIDGGGIASSVASPLDQPARTIAAGRLRDALHTWTAPLQTGDADTQQFRLCFVLTPPPKKVPIGSWYTTCNTAKGVPP